MATENSVIPRPRRKVDPGLVIAILVGCIVASFAVRYTAKKIPNRAVGGLSAQLAGDAQVIETPASSFSATGDVRGVGFDPQGNIFVGDRDAFTLCDAKSGKVLRTFDTEENGVRTLAVSPTGNTVTVSLSYAGEVRLYETEGNTKPLLTFRSATDQEQQSIAYSPDGENIASGGFDKIVRIWGAAGGANTTSPGAVFDTTQKTGAGGKLDTRMIKVGDNVSSVAFSADGKQVAVATGPKVTLYDVASGKPGKTFFADKNTVTATALSPDGKQLAVGAASGDLVLYEVATGRKAASVNADSANGGNYGGGGTGVSALQYAPGGKALYAAQKSGLLQGIDSATGKITKIYAEENTASALSLATAADGKKAVVGYSDGSVRVWNL